MKQEERLQGEGGEGERKWKHRQVGDGRRWAVGKEDVEGESVGNPRTPLDSSTNWKSESEPSGGVACLVL